MEQEWPPIPCARSFSGLSPALLPGLSLVPLAGFTLSRREPGLGSSRPAAGRGTGRGDGSLPRSLGRGRLCHTGGATRWQPWPGRRPPCTGASRPCGSPEHRGGGCRGVGAAPRARCERWEQPRGEVVVPGSGGERVQGTASRSRLCRGSQAG